MNRITAHADSRKGNILNVENSAALARQRQQNRARTHTNLHDEHDIVAELASRRLGDVLDALLGADLRTTVCICDKRGNESNEKPILVHAIF